MSSYKIEKISNFCYRIPATAQEGMRVPGIVYADQELLKKADEDNALKQVVNVAFLPGIVKASLAMPDIHWGYGFPIGGVAATTTDGGVISPGGVGFDINCLGRGTKVLHEHGYVLNIEDFEKQFTTNRVVCMNFGERAKSTDIALFLRRPVQNLYKIETSSGYEVTATGDHPFYTPEGMKKVEEIEKGKLALYPFEGVSYENPLEKTVVSEKDILALPLKKDLRPTVKELKKRHLLPLKTNNEKLPYLLKIMGFILGDGTMYFTGNKGTIWFYGEEEDLRSIQEDIKKLGFKASRIYSRTRNHQINTSYGEVKFSRKEYSIKTTASSLATLLWAMGLFCGDKASRDYKLPEWLFSCALWQKRLFLASLFGAELSSPSSVTDHGYNFYGPVLSMNKKEKVVISGERFLGQIKDLLEDFEVNSTLINKRREYVNKKGVVSYRLRLQISSEPENLIRLWSKIGFEYNQKKRSLANAAVLYLRLKQKVLKERQGVIKRIGDLKKEGIPLSNIYSLVESKYVNRRFIARSFYKNRKTPPRIAIKFPLFSEFFKKVTRGLGLSGMIWDEIIEKKQIAYQDYVYDFTVTDKHHNFVANSFVVSNCGIRLLKTNLKAEEIYDKLEAIMHEFSRNIPKGVGSKGKIRLNHKEMEQLMVGGVKWAVKKGYGWEQDIAFTEDRGSLEGANPDKVSSRAFERGFNQPGTLGAGNHFLELQEVTEIYLEEVAEKFGLFPGQLVVMIHSGSRGFGHQICTDYLKVMDKAVRSYGFNLPDRQLACAPVNSPEGKDYFSAMACAVNYAWVNRHCLAHWARQSFEYIFKKSAESLGMSLLYDVAHNIAKFEEHELNGKKERLCVHRKGATRAFGPGQPSIPEAYRNLGQPVIIPGDMGRASYILVGTEKAMKESFGSTCHGAGRMMSRSKAKRQIRGDQLKRELEEKGIVVVAGHMALLAEEAPAAYKDVSKVVEICQGAGISNKVAKLKPLGVLKG